MASRTAKGIYESLGKISQEEGVDFGISGMSESQFKSKYFTGPGNLGVLHDKLNKISDETGIDFGQGSKEEWLSSFGFGRDGKSYTVKKPQQTQKKKADAQASSPAATVAEKARNITNSKPQQSVAQPQAQPAVSAPKAGSKSDMSVADYINAQQFASSIKQNATNVTKDTSKTLSQAKKDAGKFDTSVDFERTRQHIMDTGQNMDWGGDERSNRINEQFETEINANRLGSIDGLVQAFAYDVENEIKNAKDSKSAQEKSIGALSGDLFGSGAAKNKSREREEKYQQSVSTEGLLSKLQDKDYFDDIVSVALYDEKGNVRQYIKDEANRLGMSYKGYIHRFTIPGIVQRMQGVLQSRDIEKYMPKGLGDYLLAKFNESASGMLTPDPKTKSQRRSARQALSQYEEALGNGWQGFFAKAGGAAMEMLGDFPFMLAGGGVASKVGGAIGKRIMSSAIKEGGKQALERSSMWTLSNLARLNGKELVTAAGREYAQALPSSVANMMVFGGSKRVINTLYADDNTSGGNLLYSAMEGIGGDILMGSALGSLSPLSKSSAYIGGKGVKGAAARLGTKAVSKGAEVSAFVGLDRLSYDPKLNNNKDFSYTDSFINNGAIISGYGIAGKISHGKNPFKEMRALWSGARVNGVTFTADEANYLREYSGGSLLDFLNGADDLDVNVYKDAFKKRDVKRISDLVPSKDGISAFLSNPNIPWTIRQKTSIAVLNVAMSSRPLYDHFSTIGNTLVTEAVNGEAISVHKFENGEDIRNIVANEKVSAQQYKIGSIATKALYFKNSGENPDLVSAYEDSVNRIIQKASEHDPSWGKNEETGKKKFYELINKEPHRLNDNERELLRYAMDELTLMTWETAAGKAAPEVAENVGDMDAEKADLTSDEPNIEVVAEVNGAVAEATDAYAKANEEYYAAEAALRNFEELNGKESFTYQDVEELRNNGYVEAADAVENYLRATDNAIAAQNTFNNATIRKQAFEQGVDKRISEAVDIHFAGIAFSGRIKTDESPEGAEVNGDHVVTVTDNEGNVRYLRGGVVEPDGKITSESGMVIVVNENGEMDYRYAGELQVVENGILTKEQVAPGMKEWIKQAIANEYGVGVEQAPREAEPAPAEAKQPSAEAKQGDAETKQPETEAKQPQDGNNGANKAAKNTTGVDEELKERVEAARSGDKKAQEGFELLGLSWEKKPVVRFVSKGEVDSILAGEKYNGRRGDGVVDVTNSETPTTASSAEYKVVFNDDLDWAYNGRLRMKNEELGDGWITDGYTIDDVKTITKIEADGKETVVYDARNKTDVNSETVKNEETDNKSAEETLVNQEDKTPVDEGEMPMTEVGGKKKPDWNRATPRRAHDYIYNERGLEKDDADAFVKNVKKSAKDALSKLKGKKPEMGSDIDEFLEKTKQWEEKVSQKENEISYWEEVERIQKQKEFEEQTSDSEGRKSLLDKKKDLRKKMQAAKEIYGDLFDDEDTPRDVMELVAMTLPHNINWEGRDGKKGLQQELGLRRKIGKDSDTKAFQSYLAPKGEGMSFDEVVHSIWQDDYNLLGDRHRFDDQEIRNALLDLLTSASTVSDIRDYVYNRRIEQAEAMRREEDARMEEWAEAVEWAEAYHMEPEERDEFESYIRAIKDDTDWAGFDAAKEEYLKEEIDKLNNTPDNEQNKGSREVDSQYDERREDKNGAAGEGEVRGQSSYQVDKTNTSERPNGRPEGNEGNAPISADNVPGRASEGADGGVVGYDKESNTWEGVPKEAEVISNGKPDKYGDIYGYTSNNEISLVHNDKTGTFCRVWIEDTQAETPAKIVSKLEKEGYKVEIHSELPSYVDFKSWDEAVKFEQHVRDIEESIRKQKIENLSTEELEKRAKFFEVAAKTDDELYDNEEYVDIINELEGRTNDLYDRVKDATDEQIISALGGDEMLDAVKDAIEKLRKGEELGQIETGLLKAVALAKKEEAAKTADKANGEKPKAGVTKLGENGTLVVGGVPKLGESNAPKQEEAPSPAKDVRREELKAEFDAAAQEAKDALLDFFTKPHGSDKASAMLIPVTEGQIKGFTRTVRAVGKLGYTAIKLGAYDFKTWCDRVLEQMGDFFREKLGWDEKNISDFLSEMWEMKFRLGDEVHTIKEWAESEKAKLAGDSAEYADRESKKDRFKSVVEKTLRESLVDESKRIKSITELRKIAKECGLENVRDTDLQEMVELAIVDIARKFEANKEISPKDRFDQVKRLYELQPSLNQRDTDRIMMQQYSTPAPMALLMGRFVNPDGKATSGLEPSAGNGMLTIGLPKEIMHVNEIDEARLSNLQKQGFKAVTNQDGTLSFGGKKYKIVVTNPPFGSTLPKEYDGYTISGLEHQMAINALESMEDDGRAAIIIGGRTEYAQNGAIKGRDKAFLSYLYQHYDVVDVINMDGKTLYARQGTGYPTRMILINGRRTGEDALKPHFPPVFSKARAELVRDYDELYKRIEDDILRNKDKSAGIRNGESGEGDRGNDRADVAPADDKGVSGVRTTGRSEQPKSVATGGDLFSQPVGGGTTDGTKQVEGSGNAKGAGNDGVDKQPTPDNRGGQQSSEASRTATGESGQGNARVPERPDNTQRPIGGNGEPVGNGQRRTDAAQPKRGLGTEKVPYRQQSSNPFSLHSLMPAEQADQVKAKLEELGDVDAFVTNELGYSSVEEMHAGLAAEQVDSVALAIHQMNNGSAFIIGDQTGIGKGRQAAALIRYGVKKGGCPVFITVKKGLFSDMYRDLCDIGSPELRPFIWSADDEKHSADVTDADGNTIFKRPSDKEQKRVVEYINKHGKLPPEYDYVLTTYDSFKSGTKEYENGEKKDRKFGKKQNPNSSTYKNGQAKRDALEVLAQNSYVIMDESHNAGGEGSNVGGYLQYITAKAKGITFLSATFAKRPGNMPIYSLRTAIAKASVELGDLIDAVKRGGATFQEVMSKALTAAGQMIRRERDMTGVTIDWKGIEDEEVIQKQREQYDTVIGLFNEIIDFQKRFVDPIVIQMNDDEAEIQGNVGHTPGTKDMGINNVPFASRTYNIVQQVLLSLKAEESAKRAIEHIKQGRKAVIAVANTNEGAADLASNMGEDMEMPDLSVNLKKGLEGVLRITNQNAKGDKTNTTIPLEKLSDEGRQRYAEIMEHIESASSGLSLSPIDVMKNELRKAGYRVGELTGRKAEFVYNEDGTVKRVKRTDTDKKRTAAQFNNGELDALILNRSAGTGISLHASSKFKDQRPRIMIVAQAQGDVNDEVQIRGRIDRTGQVARGMYEYVVSNIPSEQRLLMMLKSKLRSLDANTTSSQKSKFNEMQVQDIMNKYGDEVLIQYLSEHLDTYAKLADPLKLGDDFEALSPEDFVKGAQKADGDGATASKILGRMALLSVKEQEAMLDDITELYTAEINRLNDMGENDLEITEMPLRAKTLDKKVWEEGAEPNSGNPFADNTYVETVEMDILKKPMKASEVKASQERLLNGRTYEEYRNEQTEKLDKWQEEKKASLRAEYEERALRTAEKEREKYLKAALKNREKSGMTEQQCEDMADAQYKIKYDGVMEKLDTQLRNVDIQRRAFDRVLEQFDTEHVYVLPSDIYDLTQIDFGSHFGKVIGIKISNNFSTASSTVTFATLDGRRKITVPVSGMVKNKNGEKSDLFKWIDINTKHVQQGIKGPNAANTLKVLEMSNENWDKMTSSATRKKGYIVTGNLLQALVSTKQQNIGGKLISYTTDTGEVRQGLLMSDTFDPKSVTGTKPISDAYFVIAEQRQRVTSADGDVTIDWRYGDMYSLRVPKSVKSGGKYFQDSELLDIVDDNSFYTRGGGMFADIRGEENLKRVLDILSKKLKVGVQTDNEGNINPNPDVLHRQSGYTEEQKRRWDEKENRVMFDRIKEFADKTNISDRVELHDSTDGLPEYAKSDKGWYDPQTGKIHIMINNHESREDVMHTLLHESVAHYGLRHLFGENFNTFLDEAYRTAEIGIREAIDKIAKDKGLNTRTATEEYMAELTKEINFEKPEVHSWWERIKSEFVKMLHKLGDGFGIKITDDELKYVLWRSYENMKDPKKYKSLRGKADDIAKRIELGIATEQERMVARSMEQDQTILHRKLDAKNAEDKKRIDDFEKSEKIKSYRSMQVIDGKLYPPMNAAFSGALVEGLKPGDYDMAEEHPELAKPKKMRDGSTQYYFDLDKATKDATGKKATAVKGVLYDPYLHSKNNMLNDQFKSAWIRPNVVTVELEIAKDDLNSGYRAEKAGLSVGEHEWKPGTVAKELIKEGRHDGKLYLTQMAKIVRVVPDAEVAENIAKMVGGTGIEIPENVVQPKLRTELEKLGVKIGAPQKGVNKTEQIEQALQAGLEVQNTIRLRGGDNEDARSQNKVAEHTSQHIATMRSAVQSAIDGLGGKGKVVSSEAELDATGRRALKKDSNMKGYYDIATGEVVVYLPNCESGYDAVKTVMHEKVGHEGLRQALGEEGYRQFYTKLWMSLSEAERKAISEKASRRKWDFFGEAMDETLAEKAEDFTDEGHSFIESVKDALTYVAAKLGINRSLTPRDVRIALWLSKNRLTGNENNLQYKLAKAAFEAKVRRYAPKEPTNFDGFKFTKDDAKAVERAANGDYIPSCLDGVYDSDGNIRTKVMSEEEREALDRSLTPAGRYARTRYEDDLKRASYLWTEGHQNNLASLDIAQNSIAGGREKVKDSENALWELNHLSSKNREAQGAYEREYIEPLLRQIARMLPNLDGKDSHEKFVALEHYVTAKSGLERNRAFAVRDYRDKLLRKAGRTQAKANSLLKQADVLQAEVDALMDADPENASNKKVEEEKVRAQAEKALKEATNLREKAENFLAEYDKKRNSLVTDLTAGKITLRDFYEELDSFIGETIEKFDVSKADRSGLSDSNVFPEWAGEDKGAYDDNAVIEHVMEMESRLGKWAVEDLWGMIDKMAKFAVEKSYVSGEITKEAKDRANTMFTWYVPLRGFDADTAEDMWNYLDLDKSGVGRTLMGAKGRTSASDSPLNTLMLLGNSAILRGNRNVAKQALVRLVRNNPNNLISEYETWYKVGEDAEGNTVLAPSYPELTEEMTPKQIADAIREHEEMIKEEMEEGVAVYRKLKDSPKNMPYRVLRPKQMAQHFINVNINGKPVTLVVHSHPRVAQAVNGLLVNSTRGLGGVIWLNKVRSQLATSKSATFIARNAMRDYELASLSIASTESAAYLGNFQKMYWQLWGKALGNAVPGTAIEVGNMVREAVNKAKNGEAAEPTENKSGVVNSMRILFKKQRAGELNTRKKPNGEYENEVEGYFDEFVKGGGVTGYVQLAGLDAVKEKTLETLDSYFSDSTADKVKKMSAKTIGKVFKMYFDAIEAVNEAVENQTRFSAYYASRKAGRTRLRSVQDAKRVSVNFNNTGSGSAVLSMKFGDSSAWYKANRRLAGSTAWYFKNFKMFYNAGVQGMSRTAQMWLNGGKGTKAKLAGMIGAVPFMLGASLPYLNGLSASALDDDDDRKKYGENPYLQLPDYERRHNLCLYMGKGRWFKIPVFIEGSTFFGLGDIAAGYSSYPELLGNKNIGVQVAEAVTQVTPVDGFGGSKVGYNDWRGAMLGAATPDLAQPGISMWTNVGWTGSPISRSNEWNENDPNWTKGSEKTQSVYVDIAHMLNSATGGKDAADGTGVTKGAIDLDPAKMQYLVEQYFSSPGKEIVSYADILSSMVEEDKDVDWGRAPVLKAVYRDNTPYNIRNNDITRWYSYVEDSKKTEHDIREFRKHGSIVDARAIMDSKEGRQLRVIKTYAPIIKKLKTAKNMATRRADANLIQEKIAALTAEAMDRIDEIEKADKEK